MYREFFDEDACKAILNKENREKQLVSLRKRFQSINTFLPLIFNSLFF